MQYWNITLIYIIIIITCLTPESMAFVPAKIMTAVIGRLDSKFQGNLGKVSESLVHDEIMKRGLIQSVVRYFYDQPNGTFRINLTKIDNEYYDLTKLYYDYYGKYLCDSIPLQSLITIVFQPNVAVIDFDSATKDLPYAHFDAEKFNESNARVMDHKDRIMAALNKSDYGTARSLSAQIMHTIQDFYSHSNWVEMGMTDLNYRIGFSNFSTQKFTSPTDADNCNDNCVLIEEECKSLFVQIFAFLINAIGLTDKYTCPLKYYNCSNNIMTLDKVLSGYYSDQKLPDGTPVDKPVNLNKCSHGGTLDGSSLTKAAGGINKDSGYLIFSPHANLHLKAANLAIRHTQLFFNNIRSTIGDDQFASFLQLRVSEKVLNSASSTVMCSAPKLQSNTRYLIVVLILIFISHFIL